MEYDLRRVVELKVESEFPIAEGLGHHHDLLHFWVRDGVGDDEERRVWMGTRVATDMGTTEPEDHEENLWAAYVGPLLDALNGRDDGVRQYLAHQLVRETEDPASLAGAMETLSNEFDCYLLVARGADQVDGSPTWFVLVEGYALDDENFRKAVTRAVSDPDLRGSQTRVVGEA